MAQRYGVNANLLFTWRLAALAGDGCSRRDVGCSSCGVGAGRMEIVLIGGERIVVGADVDASSLARVVKALSRQ